MPMNYGKKQKFLTREEIGSFIENYMNYFNKIFQKTLKLTIIKKYMLMKKLGWIFLVNSLIFYIPCFAPHLLIFLYKQRNQ